MLKKLMTNLKFLSLPIILLTMFTISSGEAAIFKCSYQEEPCNQNGDHYQCSCWGWCGPEPLSCSPVDRSTRRAVIRHENNQNADQLEGILNDTEEAQSMEACVACHNEPIPSKFCRTQCRCTSAFCGSW